MMTAKDAISSTMLPTLIPSRKVPATMPLPDVLPNLLDAPERLLAVIDEEGHQIGVISESSLLEALGRMIAPRDDSSVITVECRPVDYSASSLAHAVEDADTHLVDMLSRPYGSDLLHVTLRVRTLEPSSVVANLERYGFKVVDASGHRSAEDDLLDERLALLATYLNI